MLDQGAELAERLVVFRDQEQGVIAEAVAAARGGDDPAAARSARLEPDRAGRVRQGKCTDERRTALGLGTC
jgi:hypothetical protein